jgi:hypothetical protein
MLKINSLLLLDRWFGLGGSLSLFAVARNGSRSFDLTMTRGRRISDGMRHAIIQMADQATPESISTLLDIPLRSVRHVLKQAREGTAFEHHLPQKRGSYKLSDEDMQVCLAFNEFHMSELIRSAVPHLADPPQPRFISERTAREAIGVYGHKCLCFNHISRSPSRWIYAQDRKSYYALFSLYKRVLTIQINHRSQKRQENVMISSVQSTEHGYQNIFHMNVYTLMNHVLTVVHLFVHVPGHIGVNGL